jgi:hypothetical protein
MSRNFAVLGKAGAPVSFGLRPENPAPAPAPGPYGELIGNLFRGPAAVALIGAGGDVSSDASVSSVAETLASELAAQGKRVIIVPVGNLLRLNPIPVPDESSFIPGHTAHVWLWPTSTGQKIEFFKPADPPVPGNWLDALRHKFHAVLLDCPHVQQDHGIAEIAAMSDAAVLAVEAGVTPKFQIQQNQRALQLRGVTVAGCILIHRK